MARLETWYKQDLKKPLIVHKHADVFNQDSRGNLIGVEVYKDGEPVTLAGSISGYCLLADGTTVPAVGASRSGNKASVLIPQTAYSVPGPITITIKNVEGNDIATLCAVVGLVRQSVSGNLVNPGSVVTDWSNSINAQLQAVQTAADNVGAIVAAPFDENTVYVAGNYVTNNGNLYRITADHASGVTWADTSKVQCTVGSELFDLKSAFSFILDTNTNTYIPVGGSHEGTELTYASGYIDLSGVFQLSGSYSCSDYMELRVNPIIDAHMYGYPTVSSIAFYRSDKSFISGISASTNYGAITGIQEIPDGAYYVRLVFTKADVSGYVDFTSSERYSTEELESAKAEIREEISAVDEKVDAINEKFEKSNKINVTDITGGQSGFIDSTGGFNSSASWIVTRYILVKNLSAISEHVNAYTTVPYAVFYDKYMVFIGSKTAETGGVQNINITVPANAYYIRFNMFTPDTTQYYEYTIDELKTAAISTKNNYDPLYGKKIGAVGDSITIGTYSVPGMTYVNQIANAHNMTVDNQAIWGSVFPTGKTQSGQPQGSIYSQVASVSADCDMLIICGGINDADYQADESYWGAVSGGYSATLDTTTFCGAFEGTLKSALDKFKGKPILFVFEHRMTTKYQSQYGVHFEDVQYPLMIEMLNKWGIPYVDLFHDMPSIKLTPGYIALYSFDDHGIHPNIAGYRKFYVPRVESGLEAIAR